HKLEKYYPDYRRAYYDVKCFFKEQRFEHRQGSGYVSKKKLIQADIIDLLDVMNTELPWMSDCVTKIDVTNIGVRHDLKDLLRNIAVASEEDIPSPEEI
ncbi:MAG: hypothetical protein NC548_23435, partial [Lachnospiraceae bacterium]|nr:hypothetical protein [Lachnospiraceae bacterium]